MPALRAGEEAGGWGGVTRQEPDLRRCGRGVLNRGPCPAGARRSWLLFTHALASAFYFYRSVLPLFGLSPCCLFGETRSTFRALSFGGHFWYHAVRPRRAIAPPPRALAGRGQNAALVYAGEEAGGWAVLPARNLVYGAARIEVKTSRFQVHTPGLQVQSSANMPRQFPQYPAPRRSPRQHWMPPPAARYLRPRDNAREP
jgi:hypothetical protein